MQDDKVPKRQLMLVGIAVFLTGILLIVKPSSASFQVNKTINIMDAKVGDFRKFLTINVYIDNVLSSTNPLSYPSNATYDYSSLSCNNGGSGTFNTVSWTASITNPNYGLTTCSIYFVTKTKIVSGDKITIIAGVINVDYDVNMIPVVYNSSGQTVKADETNKDSTYYWFDYCQKTSSGLYGYKASGCTFRWANVVLVSATNRATYKSASPGTLITETDILAYFVYIPRYRYQLWNANNSTSAVQTINITFENKTTAPICGGNTCTTSRVYSTGSNSQWLTHPAFTFGTTQLNGIWVGKFETSPDETSTCYSASLEANCSATAGTAITPRIKPNKNSWRYATILTMYTVSGYFKSNSMYGLSSSSIDAHMMKNMEWGAVSYFSQSIYGKKGNQGTQIWINNYFNTSSNNNTLTGCCALSATASQSTVCTYSYPNSSGIESSTTGSLYGIYDMSGGALEYVMGNMAASGQTPPATINTSSGGTFSPAPNSKYFDSYSYGTTSNDATAYARGYLGDATKETLTCLSGSFCSWNSGFAGFTFSTYPWFDRGGYWSYPTNASIWSFNYYGGGASEISFRPTLVVE